jgi:hypothetical protein
LLKKKKNIVSCWVIRVEVFSLVYQAYRGFYGEYGDVEGG